MKSGESESSATGTLSERAAFSEILTWSEGRPPWQRDALRRLVVDGCVTDEDIEALRQICCDSTAAAQPLSADHIASEAADGDAISLLRIERVTGVNALALGQELSFARSGLTVIYGDNGSGKSGYVRVLKRACRTRDPNPKILREVADTMETPQTATITFVRGAQEVPYDWTPTSSGPPELSAVSIFDSRSASIHVEKSNAVAYTPRPMRVLQALADACDLVRTKLEEKLSSLATQTPQILKSPTLKRDTAAGAFVHAISDASNIAQLELLVALSADERRRLAALEIDLAQDPKRAAAQVSAQKARLDEYAKALQALVEASSDVAFGARDRAKAEWDAKASAARLASEALFAAAPLPDVGKDTWRSLWEAARKYSDEVAYPDKVFPAADAETGLCVLCQQALDVNAIERQETFEKFVKGATRAEEESAAAAYRALRTRANTAKVSFKSRRAGHRLLADELAANDVAEIVRVSATQAAWRLRALLDGKPLAGAPSMSVFSELTKLSSELSGRIAQLSAAEGSAERALLIRARDELRDRALLGSLVDDIKAEVARRRLAAAIRLATRDTATNSITTKNRQLSERLVTNALRGRFAREVQKLKLSRMPVELRKTRDQVAASYFQVCLVERPDEPVAEIFSEGEHRCVALAAFLAELVTSKKRSGIVFDDPVSSLDHIHRRAVAARLVEEADHRQVVVFTHDLAFLYELRRAAEGKPFSCQTVRRKDSGPGHVEGDLPTSAKSALQLTNALRSELKAEKGHFDHWQDTKRTIFCKGIIEQLREAWDRGIADFVYPVLERFDNRISGSSLFKLAVLTEDDVRIVTSARMRLSEDLHVSAEALNPEQISHSALVDEVAKLELWISSIANRQKDAIAPT